MYVIHKLINNVYLYIKRDYSDNTIEDENK